MRRSLLAIWFLLPAMAFPQTAPPGDIYESGTPQSGAPPAVSQAFQKLYQLTAEITSSPGSLYVNGPADKSHWPQPDQAQAQWDNAMLQSGTALTQDQRSSIVPCVAHLNAAIADEESGYTIQTTQQSSPLAQRRAVVLEGDAKLEFAKCLSSGVSEDNGGIPSNGTPATGTPGSNSGGTPGGTNGGTPGSNGGVPTDPGLTPSPESPGALPLPPGVRQQLLKTAAQMDKVLDDAQDSSLAATNRFFKCLGEAISTDLKFLAQPGYVPAAQIANSLHSGVTNYFIGNAYANNLQAYQAAQQSLNTLKTDPACVAANIAPTVAAIAVTHLSGAAAEAGATQAAAEANATEATEATAAAEASTTQAAANDAMKVATEETERETAWKAGPGKFGANPANPKNPACAPNMCFSSAIAEEMSQEFGVQLSAEPFAGNVTVKIIDGVPTNVFNLTTNKTIQTMLQASFGSKKLQGPALSPERIADQMIGAPSPMTSGAEIQQELVAAGPGARGIVIVEYNPTAADPLPAGHVFNVRNVNGVPMARDFSNAGIDAGSFFQGVKQIWFYRTQ